MNQPHEDEAGRKKPAGFVLDFVGSFDKLEKASTFDTALLHQPAAFRAEVIVHELLHLKVPNHGRLFKALLRSYLAAAMPEGAR